MLRCLLVASYLYYSLEVFEIGSSSPSTKIW